MTEEQFQRLPAGAEEMHKIRQSVKLVSTPTFQTGTYEIKVRPHDCGLLLVYILKYGTQILFKEVKFLGISQPSDLKIEKCVILFGLICIFHS